MLKNRGQESGGISFRLQIYKFRRNDVCKDKVWAGVGSGRMYKFFDNLKSV